MLKKLRNKKTAKKIWIVLAIILVPAFVWWGTGSITRDKPQSLYAGVIFGRKVSTLEYQDALNAVRNLATLKYGDKLPEMSKYMNLEAQAWERLVLLKEGQKLRLSASDKEVVDTIQNLPFFQSNGRFNDRAYSDILQYELHIQPRAFEEQTRQNIIVAKLYNQITAPVTIKDEEVREEYQKDNEQISVYYIAALSADFAKEINASDQEIRDYFAKNSLDFKQPFSFSVEYASFAAQEYGEQQAKDMIKKIFQRLNKKEDFSSVAKDFGSTVKESGLFSETGPIPGVGWAPQVIGIISRTKTGEYLPPIRMDSSYYIMKVKEIKAPFIPDFDAIKDKVKEALVKNESQKAAKARIDEAFEKIASAEPKSADFERMAKELGLKYGVTALFKFGSYIEGIGGSDVFWTKARQLQPEQSSGIIDTPEGFYIIKLKSRAQIDEKKFGEEKSEFAESLLLQKKSEYFNKFLKDLKTKTQQFF